MNSYFFSTDAPKVLRHASRLPIKGNPDRAHHVYNVDIRQRREQQQAEQRQLLAERQAARPASHASHVVAAAGGSGAPSRDRIAFVIYSPQGTRPLEMLGIHKTVWRGAGRKKLDDSLAAAVASPAMHDLDSGVRCQYDKGTHSQLLYIPSGAAVSFLKPSDSSAPTGRPASSSSSSRKREPLPATTPQQVIALQLCCGSASEEGCGLATVELFLSGRGPGGTACHLIFTNVVRQVQVCSHHVKLPLRGLRCGEWTNLFFDVEALYRTFAASSCSTATGLPVRGGGGGGSPRVVDIIVSGGGVLLRRVLSMAALPALAQDTSGAPLAETYVRHSGAPNSAALPESLKLPPELSETRTLFVRTGDETALVTVPAGAATDAACCAPSTDRQETAASAALSSSSAVSTRHLRESKDSATPRPPLAHEKTVRPFQETPVNVYNSGGAKSGNKRVATGKQQRVPQTMPLPQAPLEEPIPPLPSPPPPPPPAPVETEKVVAEIRRPMARAGVPSSPTMERLRAGLRPVRTRPAEAEPVPSLPSSPSATTTTSDDHDGEEEEDGSGFIVRRPSPPASPLPAPVTAKAHERSVSPLSPWSVSSEPANRRADAHAGEVMVALMDARVRRIQEVLGAPSTVPRRSAPRPSTTPTRQRLEQLLALSPQLRAASEGAVAVVAAHPSADKGVQTDGEPLQLAARPISPSGTLTTQRLPWAPAAPVSLPLQHASLQTSLVTRPLTKADLAYAHTPSTSDILEAWRSTEEPLQVEVPRAQHHHHHHRHHEPRQVANRLCFDSSDMISSNAAPPSATAPTPAAKAIAHTADVKDRAAGLLARLRAMEDLPSRHLDSAADPHEVVASSWTFHSAGMPQVATASSPSSSPRPPGSSSSSRGKREEEEVEEGEAEVAAAQDQVRVIDDTASVAAVTVRAPSAPLLERQGTPLPWPRSMRLNDAQTRPAPRLPLPDERPVAKRWDSTQHHLATATTIATAGGAGGHSAASSTSLRLMDPRLMPSSVVDRYASTQTTDTTGDSDFAEQRVAAAEPARAADNGRYVYDPVLRCFLDLEENDFLEDISF